MSDIIKGAGGGGGKGGGGSANVPVEAPDTLRSIQYAKVVDLISEGEIEGLVDGLKSVYLNDTPIQNENGTLNFRGVTIDTRNGTQSQSYMAGFEGAEAETIVGTEVRFATPVVRSISNVDTTAVRVTLGFPQLTSQDTSTGDLNGTSVSIAIDIQNNGGGYVAQPLRKLFQSNVFSVASGVYTGTVASSRYIISVNWTGEAIQAKQTCTFRLEYRLVGGTTWTTSTTYTFTGGSVATGQLSGVLATAITYASGTKDFSLTLPEDEYEFRLVKTTGSRQTSTETAFGYVLSPPLTGSQYGGTVAISMAQAYVPVFSDTISGKTTSRYQRAYRIELPAGGPWDIRVRRLTADSSQAVLQNKTFFDSYTEIIDAKLAYPNSALVGMKIDSKQFNSIPTRGYEIFGIKIQVPSNYDPLTRAYTGSWDGTFVTAWSDNPAWVFYDLITNARYGLGEFIDESQVDKWALYTIAQYCDANVPDGFNGIEPRFTCNLYIQTREEAYRVIGNLASVFRGMAYWSAGEIAVSQDSPSDVVQLFTKANIAGGKFAYSGSSGKVRHTVCLVSWNDPQDGYRQKVEYVADDDGIARYGIIQTEIVAVGCTSRGQAARIGRWLIYTEINENETITFTAGLDTVFCQIGDVIQTQDPLRSGRRFGGRTLTASTVNTINIDSPVTIESGKTYELSLVMPDGSIETSTVTNSVGSTSSLTVSPDFTNAPLDYAIWVLSANDLVPESWRVVSLVETEKAQIQVTALAYREDKYSAVENNLVLQPLPTSIVSSDPPPAPNNLIVTESLYLAAVGVVATKVTVSWDAVSQANSYVLEWVPENGNPQTVTRILTNSYDIQPIAEGNYTFAVYAVNALGRRSLATQIDVVIYGKTSPPNDVDNFQLVALADSAFLTWTASTDLDVTTGGYMRIRYTPDTATPTWSGSLDIGPQVSGTATNTTLPLLTGSYLAKWIDSSGNESENEAIITSNVANLLTLNILQTVTESPGFTGTKTDVEVSGSVLTLSAGSNVDDYGLIDDIVDWDNTGNVRPTGTYLFNNDIDIGTVQTSRLTSNMVALGVDLLNQVDDWVDIDTQESIDGGLITDVGATLFVRTTNDDPAGSPNWSEWQPFFVGDWTARAFEFKVELFTNSITHNIEISTLEVTVDMPDRDEYGEDIVSGATTYSVTYTKSFNINPALSITAQNMNTGDYYTISNKDATGFDIDFFNSGATQVSRTFDYHAKGY